MTKSSTGSNSEKLAEIIIRGIQEKKGHKITLLDLRKVGSAFTDFFVICHGTSNRQVESIADSVVEEVQKSIGEKPLTMEGKRQSEWVLLDFVNVVVHVFQEKFRDHYALEELWADAAVSHIAE